MIDKVWSRDAYLGDDLPASALDFLIEARGRAGELTAIPLPWGRSLVGFSSSALYRLGIA